MIPLFLIIIIIAYRKIQSKIIETRTIEQEAFYDELQRERARIQRENLEKKVEIEKYLDEAMKKIDFIPTVEIQSNVMEKGKGEKIEVIVVKKGDAEGESTDDEFFEMPLPPTPAVSPCSISQNSLKSEKSSIVNNDDISVISPTNPISYDTPKIDNHQIMFRYPDPPRRRPPPPPNNSKIIKDETKIKKKFDLSNLPPVPPRKSSSSLSSSSNPASPRVVISSAESNRKSSQPVIIEAIPKTLLESDV